MWGGETQLCLNGRLIPRRCMIAKEVTSDKLLPSYDNVTGITTWATDWSDLDFDGQ